MRLRLPLIAALLGIVVGTIAFQHGMTNGFFSKNLRGSLFSAFLTLAGFLLSLTVFILVKMKEGLYDNKLYRKRFKEYVRRKAQQNNSSAPAPALYEGLIQLKGLLLWSIAFSLLTAITQVTVGLIEEFYFPTAFCLGMATCAIVLVFGSLVTIGKNLTLWFDYVEDDDDSTDQQSAPEPESSAPAGLV